MTISSLICFFDPGLVSSSSSLSTIKELKKWRDLLCLSFPWVIAICWEFTPPNGVSLWESLNLFGDSLIWFGEEIFLLLDESQRKCSYVELFLDNDSLERIFRCDLPGERRYLWDPSSSSSLSANKLIFILDVGIEVDPKKC